MGIRLITTSFILLTMLFVITVPPHVNAETTTILEQSMSETLDLWREGRFEQLYERLSHRGGTSKESFISRMRETTIRPACCWQKLENFKVLSEKLNEAVVYVKVNLEGTSNPVASSTREFKLSRENDGWRMQLKDILQLAGTAGKKGKNSSRHKS